MNASYRWLQELIPVSMTPRQIADDLTAHCAPVDAIVDLRSDLAAIVVARVVSAGRHPDSDHLWVTRVDAGTGELLDVVCGAPNVRENALYPFASVGTALPDGRRMAKRKIRGVTSNGMLCSARELNLGDDQAGILELDVDVAPGTPLLSAIAVGDVRIVVDVTPNRPDLLSHIGLAREICAARGVPMKLPNYGEAPQAPAHADGATQGRAGSTAVKLNDTEGCPRYVGAVIRGVKVAESPDWIRQRLEAVGSRAVNNIVDITNLLLHECGQPMHAFDLDRMEGNAVVIRRAGDGETIETLDGVTRNLNASMTVIADARSPQAVAGVMGGAGSAVSGETTNIFLEVANFSAARVRATRISLGLSTDASYRFERGVNPQMPGESAARAIALIAEIAGGRLDGTPADLFPGETHATVIELRVRRCSALLGVELSHIEIADLLSSVGFSSDAPQLTGHGESIRVAVPPWRVDVTAEIDLVEEVARLRGFDSFPDELRPFRTGTVPDDMAHTLGIMVRSVLVDSGFLEARPLPFVQGDDSTHVAIANPISGEERHLRRSILETLAARAEFNLAHMQKQLRLFEIGHVFLVDESARPREELRVGALLMGDRFPSHFSNPRPPQFDEWDARWLAELLASRIFGENSATLAPSPDMQLLWTIEAGGRTVGQVRRLSLDAPVWAPGVFGVELTILEVPSAAVAPPGRNAHAAASRASSTGQTPQRRRYAPLPTQPAVDFDLALVVPDQTTAAAVEGLLRRESGELLESLELFDEFRGGGLPQGSRSLAWRLTFRHPERSLRDKEVEGRRQKLLTALEKQLGVRQRTS
jgi:phenylalanyl-tRNA synthetase beta chain